VSNNVPIGEGDIVLYGHLWLMFASGCYFRNIDSNSITPVYDVNASAAVNPNARREAKCELIGYSRFFMANARTIEEKIEEKRGAFRMKMMEWHLICFG
jgi:hypothetical protein